MQKGPPLVANFAVVDDDNDDAVIKREGPWRELDLEAILMDLQRMHSIKELLCPTLTMAMLSQMISNLQIRISQKFYRMATLVGG